MERGKSPGLAWNTGNSAGISWTEEAIRNFSAFRLLLKFTGYEAYFTPVVIEGIIKHLPSFI